MHEIFEMIQITQNSKKKKKKQTNKLFIKQNMFLFSIQTNFSEPIL